MNSLSMTSGRPFTRTQPDEEAAMRCSRAVVHLAMVVMAATALLAGQASAADEIWWRDSLEKAEREGYKVVTLQGLAERLQQTPPPLLLDVRPDYEYRSGHIPGASNLEFDLGDKLQLNQAKKQAFQDLAGPDKARAVIIYCRSISCIRSEIAARWAVRLGYTNVARFPAGWYEWKRRHPEDAPKEPQKRVLGVGEYFPECRLAILGSEEDRKYLDMPEDSKWLALQDVPAEYVLIEFYNSLCQDCVRQTNAMNDYYRRIEEDPAIRGRIKVMGIGVFNTKRAVVKFRKKNKVLFPLFSDRNGLVFECLGQTSLPLAYLVRKDAAGRRVIVHMRTDFQNAQGDFYRQIRNIVTAGGG